MVRQAQALLPTLPYREKLPTNALFDAYFAILPQIGQDPDHDNRYARVLFKIGGLRGPGSLLEKFERVLARMNIHVEYEYEEEIEQWEEEQPMGRGDYPTIGTNQSRYEGTMDSENLPRRNSESTKWDLGLENRSNRQTKSAEGDISGEKRAEFIQEMQRSRPSAPVPEQAREYPAEASRELVEDWLHTHQQKSKKGRGRSPSTIGSMRAPRSSTSTSYDRRSSPPISFFPPSDEFPDPSETAITSNELAEAEEPADDYNQQTPNLMNIKASVTFQYNSKMKARLQLQQWREMAIELRNKRLQMERVADTHDRTVLMTGALAGWRALSIERRQEKENQYFYEHLEDRAEKARDLFLASKALLHWADNTQEQVEKTAAARNHIVESRCFNAWHQVTTVNDFKVKRNVLKKFFGAWKKRKETVDYQNHAAIQTYQGNLAHKVYLEWVHGIWENRAYEFYTDGLKSRTFYGWYDTYRQTLDNQRIVEQNHRDQVAHKALIAWKDQTIRHNQQEEQAAAFYKAKALRNALKNWGKETRVIPALQVVESEVRNRLVRGALATWAHRAKQEKQAAAVDREKILKEAIVTWRHKLRQKVIADKVNTRVKAECMYKLVLAQRCGTLQKKRKETTIRGILHSWADKAIAAREHRLEQEAIADEYAKQKALNSVLGLWYKRMDRQKEMERQALAFARPRLLEGVFSKLLDRSEEQAQHVQELETMADDAAYYFRASSAIKKWRAAAAYSIREKRKAAYCKVRRMVKMNMARKFLRSWRDQANRIMVLNERAQEVLHNKAVVRGMDTFDKWRTKAAVVVDMEAVAREQQLKKHLALWKQKSDDHQTMEIEAAMVYEENRQSRALKKWNLETLKVQAQANYAVDIREKNAKKHFRKMFAHWHQQSQQQTYQQTYRSQPPPPPRPPPQSEPHFPRSKLIERFRKTTIETSSNFGEGSDDFAPSRSIPAYLNTPSKRRTRMTTTPKAPLSTPYERELRAQYGGEGTRGRFRISGFEDIPERSFNE